MTRFIASLRDALSPGVLAVIATVIALAGAGGVVFQGGEEGYSVQASFPRAIGLFPRSTVRVLGVEVGRVESVTPAGDRVEVVMNIREGVRVPADARAIVVPISLISDRYIQLEPVWREGPFLRDGDEIPLDRGIVPAELGDLLRTLEDFLEAIEPGSTAEPGALGLLVRNASEALSGEGEALGGTVDGLATVLDNLGRNAENLDSIILSFDRLMTSLSRRGDAIRQTNRGLASVFGALAAEQDALRTGIGNLADALSELGDLVDDHDADLRADLETLAKVTDILARNEEFLVRNLRWLPVLEQGTLNAYEQEHRRFIVRDNLQEHL